MFQRPFFVSDAQIVTILRESYGLGVETLQFTPVGEASWNYKTVDVHEHVWFVKILRHKLHPASVAIPEFLRNELGYHFVVPPLSNRQDVPWESVVGHEIMVYPYLWGKTVMDDASFDRWQEIGSIFALLHSTVLSEDVIKTLSSEKFVPVWADTAKSVVAHASINGLARTSHELAKFIQSKEQEIQAILSRTTELGSLLRQERPELVLCHADPNESNIFVTDNNEIVLIDWDGVMLAPRERDLMFFTGKQQKDFLRGYNKTQQYKINPIAIAYYKYEWVVQEIGDYGSQIFFSNVDDATKERALREFRKLFADGDVIQGAYAANANISYGQ